MALTSLKQMFGAARTRILIWYLVLMSLSSLASVLVVRQILLLKLKEQIERSLQQEVEAFRQLRNGFNPQTGTPFEDDIEALFDVFLSRNLPGDSEYLLAIRGDELYGASSLALPEALQPHSPLIAAWTQIEHPQKGRVTTAAGTILFQAEPVYLLAASNGPSADPVVGGIFIIAHLTARERAEVEAAVRIVSQVSLVVLVTASFLAWLAAGRLLAPLHLLSQTARSISESNLTERITVTRKGGDIAELAHTFNDMMDRLESTFNSQRQFLNDIGHELRTPITIIRGHLELMGPLPQDQQETLEIVLDELDRISRFVQELMLLAKAERPDFLLLETIDLALFTEELYAKIQPLADRHWQLEAIAAGQLVADRQRLTEAIINLAQNASQHTPPNGSIFLGSARQGEQVYLWIRDSGVGIAPADQQRIFERFVRGDSGQRHPEGTGLGLAIVKAIAQAHGGRVDLQSQLHEGATFTLVLPLNPYPEKFV